VRLEQPLPSSGPGPGPGSRAYRLAAGQFSFIPQGSAFTYRQLRSLSPSPTAVRRAVYAHLRSSYGPTPPVTALLRTYAVLLATAPIEPAVRAALFSDIAVLPGLRTCGSGRDWLGRYGTRLCVLDPQYRVDVLLDVRSGSVLAVEERVREPVPLYADLPAGSVVEADTFSSNRSLDPSSGSR
jgi:hypothetical protein